MRGMGKGGGGRGLVADLDIDAEIAGGFVPQLRRARFQRVGGKCDRRQRVVCNVQPLGRVFRLGDGVGDDHRDRLADIARLVGRQREMAGRDQLAAAAHGHVGRVHQPGIVRDGPEPGSGIIGPGQHRQDTGCSERRAGVDRPDPRMRMGRAHDDRMHKPRQRQIIDKAAAAGQEPPVLLAPHRPPNAVLHPAAAARH